MSDENIKQMEAGKYKIDEDTMRKLLQSSQDYECPNCKCKIFDDGLVIKKISALDPNNPSGKDSFTQIPVIYCVHCKTPLQG